jgi:F0F1-type ATP synthase assembly protein I
MFAAGVIVFMAGGWVLDRWLGTFPVLLVLGALIGAVLSTLSIYRRLLIGGENGDGSDEPQAGGHD